MSRIDPRIHRCKNGAEILIRIAEVQDAARVMEMAHQTAAERGMTLSEWEDMDRTVVDEKEWIRKAADHPGDIILVAAVAGDAVGMLDFTIRRRLRMAHTGEFGMSVVSPWQNQGIGRGLLRALIDWATSHPILEKIDLGVFASNHGAMHLYYALGFREEGRRKNAVKLGQDQYDDLILMSRVVKGN